MLYFYYICDSSAVMTALVPSAYAMTVITDKYGDEVAADIRDEIETMFNAVDDAQEAHTLVCELADSSSLAVFFLLQAKKQAQRRQSQEQPEREPTQRLGSSLFTCPKCRVANCEYTQVQTRSADESMTNFCRCLSCNNRWRE